MAMGVGNSETWQQSLEDLHTDLEVLNFGVGAYGFDQAFLRYVKEGRAKAPDVVIMGFMSENIYRSVNTYRPFYTPRSGIPLSKPRFRLTEDSGLRLVPNTIGNRVSVAIFLEDPTPVLQQMGEEDFYYPSRHRSGLLDVFALVRIGRLAAGLLGPARGEGIIVDGAYDSSSEAFRVTMATFDLFHKTVRENGAQPLILLFPDRGDVDDFLRSQTTRYAPLARALTSRGYAIVDLVEAFSQRDSVDVYSDDHYSAAGNRRVAAFLNESGVVDSLRRTSDVH